MTMWLQRGDWFVGFEAQGCRSPLMVGHRHEVPSTQTPYNLPLL
jgi:hypothetical protein